MGNCDIDRWDIGGLWHGWNGEGVKEEKKTHWGRSWRGRSSCRTGWRNWTKIGGRASTGARTSQSSFVGIGAESLSAASLDPLISSRLGSLSPPNPFLNRMPFLAVLAHVTSCFTMSAHTRNSSCLSPPAHHHRKSTTPSTFSFKCYWFNHARNDLHV